MTITVGDLREFLSDSANSMADTQAARILDRVIQSAMRRLSREGAWNEKRRRRTIFVEPRKESDNATVTHASADVTLDSTVVGSFPLERRFYDEGWNIQLSGRETIYQFAEPPSPYSLKLSIPFGGDTTPVTAPPSFDRLNLTKSRYKLPAPFVQIYGVDLPQEGVDSLRYLNRTDFEYYRTGLLTSASQPWVYTTHSQDEIEFWPPANSDRGFECEIDLQEALRIPSRGAEDTEALDWPDHMEDLLWAAARLQLAVELGADAVQFDVGTVQSEYARMLAIYKTEDQSRGQKTWSMGLGQETSLPRPFGLNLRGPVVGE